MRALRVLSVFMVRTEQGPLRPLWAWLHARLLAAASAFLRHDRPDAAVYIRGSFAAREPVYGLSDMDVIVVLPGASSHRGRERERIERRWRRLCRVVPALGRVLALKVYEEAELAEAASHTVLTYGLNGGGSGALFDEADPSNRHYSLRTRPNLYGATHDWLHLAGPDRRPRVRVPAGHECLVAGWLELQCWWRYVAWCCLHPEDRVVPYYCLKFVAEAARIWLWVAHGERTDGRLDTLARARRLMPADETVLASALAGRKRLAGSASLLLADVLAWLVDFSSRLSGFIGSELEEAGSTDVRLRGGGTNKGGALPLADWRALVLGDPPAGTIVLDASSPCLPAEVARAAAAEVRAVHVGLRAPGILVLPSADLESRPIPRGTLRAIQCPASDPVSLAVARGEGTASFPNVSGWSAIDVARRAVAEHRARLARLRAGPLSSAERREVLLSAARAALFVESLQEGAPELHVTPNDAAGALDGAEHADELERIVYGLPAFR